MNFFFDNNLSEKLAQAMQLLDVDSTIEHLRDNFRQNEPDEVWLKYVGEKGLILITRDQKIRKRRIELLVYKQHRVCAFILTGKNLGRWREIKQLICAWEEIRSLAASEQRPFAFQVPPKGKIKPLSL
jgi:predicted nuclease of predicted toxin-antitoxin system